jgi:xanthine dehydrogenase YagT iron-sulfur-binding subunit
VNGGGDDRRSAPQRGIDRRTFLETMATAGAGVSLGTFAEARAQSAEATPPPAPAVPQRSTIVLRVNGTRHELAVDPRITLLDALRDQLQMPGTKKGCDRGQCGACTVLASGRRINACLTFAVMHDSEEITTVEGLGSAEAPSAVQAAFLECDALQCGYCTPGQLCSATALIEEFRSGTASAVSPVKPPAQLTDAEIRERMSGNICRCGAYPNIVAAVRKASGRA